MSWYDEAIFYHIYPLGLLNAPRHNDHEGVVHRLRELDPWIRHIEELNCNAVYIGPLFESVGHGYETTDYRRLDERLGDNADLADFVRKCHERGIKVILDGVFNHTGREFFAFQDIKQNREGSRYRDWYVNVNFYGNNEYNDGFSYDNWGGYNLLAKLNQRNPEVKDYICDVIRFWVKEFDIDGLRLDAADVLDFDFMKALRAVANEVKPEFWLMGEVIHGDYSRWVNEGTLHSVTNYVMHKALYSGHNDHNYFEIAHTQRRLEGFGASGKSGFKLYNFVDNHDVERIYTKLNNKAHFTPVHILLYTLPGIPSIYYGSEFAVEGRKERSSDDSLRPALRLSDYGDAIASNPATRLISALGRIRKENPELSYGDYRELLLTNRQYAFSRGYNGRSVAVAVNNDDNDYSMSLEVSGAQEYYGALGGERVPVRDGRIQVNIKANSGEIWVPLSDGRKAEALVAPEEIRIVPGKACDEKQGSGSEDGKRAEPEKAKESAASEPADRPLGKPSGTAPEKAGSYEEGIIAGLQEAVMALMEKNGQVTEQMRKDVRDNVYHDSLINWIKSFR
ncbi:MAG TPA: alpha-amylase [Lachnospiraceae bacterium]|nr:alpha-amylase [Lachnospiraceae bacterium]